MDCQDICFRRRFEWVAVFSEFGKLREAVKFKFCGADCFVVIFIFSDIRSWC